MRHEWPARLHCAIADCGCSGAIFAVDIVDKKLFPERPDIRVRLQRQQRAGRDYVFDFVPLLPTEFKFSSLGRSSVAFAKSRSNDCQVFFIREGSVNGDQGGNHIALDTTILIKKK